MKTGMKFLFRFMLTFLVVLCVAAVAVIFTQLGGDGNGDGDDSQVAVYASDRNRVEGSIEESYDGSPVHIEETDARRTWRSSSERPEDSELMPRDAFVLAGLVLPNPSPGGDQFVPIDDLPAGIRGVHYDFTIELTHELDLNTMENVQWALDGRPLSDNRPDGLYLTPDPYDLTTDTNLYNIIRIHGTPSAANEFGVDIVLTYTNPGDSDNTITIRYQSTIKIWEPPTFDNHNFPAGMVGMLYHHNNKITANIPPIPGVTWEWDPVGPSNLNVGGPPATYPGNTSTTAEIGGYPTTETNDTFRFRVTLRASSILQPVINGVEITSQEYSLRIHRRFEIITGQLLSNGDFESFLPPNVPHVTLPDGMVGPPNQVPPIPTPRGYLDEPNDVDYEVWFAVHHDSVSINDMTWTLVLDELPAGLLHAGEQFGLDTGQNEEETMAYIKGIPHLPFVGSPVVARLIDIKCDDNPNFNGSITQNFSIRIWPRTYLYTIFSNAFVMREDEEIDINYPDKDILELYRQRRAVMPGTRGIIKIDRNFVRWDVLTGLNGPATIPDTMSEVEIQGPTNLADPHNNPLSLEGWGHDGTSAFVIIKMPIMGEPNTINASNIGNNRDVRIGGVLSDASLRISPLDFDSWTVDDIITPRTLLVQSVSPNASTGPTVTELGTGLFPSAFWEIEGYLPNGLLHIDTTGISSTILGTPTTKGTFPFTIRVTLPGTMRLELPWTITIVPPDAVIVGAVNRSPNISLADLILLARVVNGGESLDIDYDAANIVTAPGSTPLYGDFIALSQWFSVPGIESPVGKPTPMME